MGRKLLLFILFTLIAILIAGYYEIIPSPWLDESEKTMDIRDEFVNKSAKVLDTDSE